MRFIIDNPNDVIQNALMNNKFHEEDELKFMKQFCPEKASILDVGANVGNHSIYFDKFFDPEIIYAIEPLPKAYRLLLANVALNYCHKINLDYIGLALGHVETIGYPVEIYENNLGSTRIFHEKIDYKGQHFEPVNVVRGDSIFGDKKIDFIKMDVEGMEMVALEGLTECIEKNRPNIFIEVSIENIEDFHVWLEYNKYIIKYEKLEPRIFCNYLIVPEEK
jgi:FkbM family methyltransferase